MGATPETSPRSQGLCVPPSQTLPAALLSAVLCRGCFSQPIHEHAFLPPPLMGTLTAQDKDEAWGASSALGPQHSAGRGSASAFGPLKARRAQEEAVV